MTILQAVFLGLLYWFSQSKIINGMSIFRMPIVLAPIIGFMFDDIPTAMIIGATIQMIYIGSIAPGGNPPADEGLAAVIAIPVALITGMKPEIAITLAIPLGILGVALENIRKTFNTAFLHRADKYAAEGNKRGVDAMASWVPILFAFPLRFIPVFVAGIYGPEVIQNFIAILPEWILHGLQVSGNILPALGIAITINVIGRRSYLPMFIIGFFAVTVFQIDILLVAIFAASALAFSYFNENENINKQEVY